ncbi:alkaline phosphatase family protein [Sphingomonas sp.]|uniref:alkaline phosphatase family protein n=1 Tax=Sphingomonas sp. TaxID=28214 RepID=UPI001B1C5792|nr:alkaline phosphatase family protein [Sphingomonas sp.]MBO9714631.1 alkaline phosphatase family protein [Sphingomonas sp.]
MRFGRSLAAALSLLAAAPLAAQDAGPTAATAPAPAAAPQLIVVISVDQFSADLFAEYRAQFRYGLARLMTGAVFPSGYQSHAATETCPGHSTILTGDHPARTGIAANDWIDFGVARGKDGDHSVYCAEDETLPGTDAYNYQPSDKHLKVPTLGEWMKLANPASRVVSVAGKDRAAIMMGGHRIDELWFWFDKNQAFISYPGRAMPAAVKRANDAVNDERARGHEALDLPDFCKPRARGIQVGRRVVGDGRLAMDADPEHKAMGKWKASPYFDAAIAGLAGDLAVDLKLGQGAAPDLLIVGASATDYVGHTLGTEGSEMCLQLLGLDRTLGKLFDRLDATGVDYAVVLTADHGGHDIPERNDEHAAPMAARVAPELTAGMVGKAIGAKLRIKGPVLYGGAAGDVYIDAAIKGKQRAAVLAEALKLYRANPQVAGAFSGAQIAATVPATTPPETWTLLERARASYVPGRSGDLIVALKPRVTPIAVPAGTIATHGSFWDYDRRVPMLFWRKGMTGFEQPLSVETVDIAPTLAALLGIAVPVQVDGRCLDLDAGPGDSCR